MGAWADFKTKFLKVRRYLAATPIEGESYEKAPDVKDLPHMVDADGELMAVSSGKRELSPVLSAKLNIQNSAGTGVPTKEDDRIDAAL
ncbi:LAFE_0D05864g1_1 [Lachancea fermentati]|uniref:LAFE_0D05864g1_1 n=1 Tax=Lachancea fermentati TaxID=4955 RepID=A0A1G4MBT3_LACFM|nr:LAFE_0D05864g1_1 [Lachancea fermentati]